jgi:hypothetical protein
VSDSESDQPTGSDLEYLRRCREWSAKFTRMPAAQLAREVGAFASAIHAKGIIVSPEVMALLTVVQFRLSPPETNDAALARKAPEAAGSVIKCCGNCREWAGNSSDSCGRSPHQPCRRDSSGQSWRVADDCCESWSPVQSNNGSTGQEPA